MYLPLDSAVKRLNISEADILTYRTLNHIYYSEKTDKYDIDSILEKRTMTIGLEKLLNQTQKDEILEYMQDFSSLKFKLVKDLQHSPEIEYKNSGTNRLHRILAKKYNQKFTNPIADSALSLAQGIVKSAETWRNKAISNLEDKITSIQSDLQEITEKNKDNDFHSNFTKGKKKKLHLLKNRLANFQGKEYLPIHFGKKALNDTDNLTNLEILDRYRKKRLELFIEGSSASKGNTTVRIEYSKSGDYQLKLFKHILNDIKIPRSHLSTFSLENFNRQAMKIAYNSKGKLVLHITYSYIKPIKIEKTVKSRGTIGIDIGPKEIAVAYVKNDGNPLKYKHYSIGNLLDKSNKDTQRELSVILDEIIEDAQAEGFYHITIENLKFKTYHKYRSNKLNRLLSNFPYRMFEELITSKTIRKGLNLRKINPAYTSIIGIFKYSNRDNLSTNHSAKSKDLSAALTIGRRGLGLNERAIISIRISGQNYSTSIKSILNESEKDLSKFNGTKKNNSNWNLWSKLNKRYKFNELTARLNANHKLMKSKRVNNNCVIDYALETDKFFHSNVFSLQKA